MAPEALARRVTALLLVCGCACACDRRASEITATWTIEPTPPVAGAATLVRLTLRHDDGTAVRGAKLKIEGHMSHPGMTPVVADVMERGNGAYEARLHLSMPGDWLFVVTGELVDGRRIMKDVAVPSVRPGP
jgi:YtkA-like